MIIILNQPDNFFLDSINTNSSISENSKEYYIKKIQTIKNEICPVKTTNNKKTTLNKTYAINKIIKEPEVFEELLESFNKLKKKKLTNKTKETFVNSIKAIFNYNTELKESNIDLYNKWDNLHKKYKDSKEINISIDYNKVLETRDKTPNDVKHTYKRLLLFIYTTLPIIGCYSNIKIYNNEKPSDTVKKYIILNDSKESKIVINKTEKTLPEELVKEIKESLKIKPREYLFIRQNGEPYENSNSYTKWANRNIKNVLNDKNINLTVLSEMKP
jgi:hypothetical protein